MILVYPLLLAAAAAIVWRHRGDAPRRSGWRWFGAWSIVGALLTFSFLTGLSIGLFVLPFAAVALVWTARRAPDAREALGIAAGAGLVAVLVAPLAGTIVAVLALVGYYARSRSRGALTPTP